MEWAIAELAKRQYGVVARPQLVLLGLSAAGIHRRMAAGRLHLLHAGVYAAGHTALTLDGRYLAAVLACGPGAALSHRAAGARRAFIRGSYRIEVTAGRGCKSKPGIVVHRSRVLAPQDRDVLDGIPITSVARTLVDLADVLTERRLADAIHQAEVQRVLDVRLVEEALARVPGRRGRHRLERVLAVHAGIEPARTRNDSERDFLALCERHGLPAPQPNASIDGHEVDFLWPEALLVVELDGGAAHHTRRAFHENRRRDRFLAVRAYQVLRVTGRDLTYAADAIAGEIAAVYAARRLRSAAAART